MPSSYLNTVAPKWAASANALIEGRTVQFYPLPLEGNVNVTSSSNVVVGTWGGTQFLATSTRRSELVTGDTMLVRPSGAGTYDNARVVVAISDAGNANINYAYNFTGNAQTIVRAKYFVVPGTDGWVSAKYIRGNATTTASASNTRLVGNATAWSSDLKAGDKVVVVGLNVNAQMATVTAVTSDTLITLNGNILLTNNHAVFKYIETLQTLPDLERTIA